MEGLFHIFQDLHNLWVELDHLSFKFSWHIQSYVPDNTFYSVWYWLNQYVHIADIRPHQTKTQVYSW